MKNILVIERGAYGRVFFSGNTYNQLSPKSIAGMPGTPGLWSSICVTDNFVIALDSEFEGIYRSSDFFESYEHIEFPIGIAKTTISGYVGGIAYGNGRLIGFGYDCQIDREYNKTCVWVSDDQGSTWTKEFIIIEEETDPNENYYSDIHEVTYLNGLFLACVWYLKDNFACRVFYSADGVNWNYSSVSTNYAAAMSIAYLNGLYLFTDGDVLHKSTNIQTGWTTVNINFLYPVKIISDNEKFILMTSLYGDPNTVLYSTTDGTSWTAHDTGRVDRYISTVYYDSASALYVIAGDDTLDTSTNLTEWTEQFTFNESYAPQIILAIGQPVSGRNYLYKNEDDTRLILIPDPPNPIQPPIYGSSPRPNYPPESRDIPDRPPNPNIREDEAEGVFDAVYGWDADYDGYDESILICTKDGCKRYIRDQNGNATEVTI